MILGKDIVFEPFHINLKLFILSTYNCIFEALT
jgi:hypothetical protein